MTGAHRPVDATLAAGEWLHAPTAGPLQVTVASVPAEPNSQCTFKVVALTEPGEGLSRPAGTPPITEAVGVEEPAGPGRPIPHRPVYRDDRPRHESPYGPRRRR